MKRVYIDDLTLNNKTATELGRSIQLTLRYDSARSQYFISTTGEHGKIVAKLIAAGYEEEELEITNGQHTSRAPQPREGAFKPPKRKPKKPIVFTSRTPPSHWLK